MNFIQKLTRNITVHGKETVSTIPFRLMDRSRKTEHLPTQSRYPQPLKELKKISVVTMHFGMALKLKNRILSKQKM